MANNRIRVVLADRGMSAKTLTDSMDGWCNTAVMSYIMNDKALPTVVGLRDMCKALGCRPEDLYDATDVDLLSAFESAHKAPVMDEQSALATWFSDSEAEALKKAVAAFGYNDVREWIRDMWRSTLLKNLARMENGAINLSEVILHESEAE